MNTQQYFSPGLLYSVAPENFSELHLQEEAEFSHEEHKHPLAHNAFTKYILSFLRFSAAKP